MNFLIITNNKFTNPARDGGEAEYLAAKSCWSLRRAQRMNVRMAHTSQRIMVYICRQWLSTVSIVIVRFSDAVRGCTIDPI